MAAPAMKRIAVPAGLESDVRSFLAWLQGVEPIPQPPTSEPVEDREALLQKWTRLKNLRLRLERLESQWEEDCRKAAAA